MAREGLMSDVGYNGFDEADIMEMKYCCRCANQIIVKDENGELYACDCNKDCCLAEPKFFEERVGEKI